MSTPSFVMNLLNLGLKISLSIFKNFSQCRCTSILPEEESAKGVVIDIENPRVTQLALTTNFYFFHRSIGSVDGYHW